MILMQVQNHDTHEWHKHCRNTMDPGIELLNINFQLLLKNIDSTPTSTYQSQKIRKQAKSQGEDLLDEQLDGTAAKVGHEAFFFL